jgi:hypothetical protein
MTLYEFNILSFEDKYKTSTEKSLLLYNYITKEEIYESYSFDTFFVEIVYDNENAVSEIRSYKTGEMLNKFSGKIELY